MRRVRVGVVVSVHNKYRSKCVQQQRARRSHTARRRFTRLRAGVHAYAVVCGLRGLSDKRGRRYHSDCLGDTALVRRPPESPITEGERVRAWCNLPGRHSCQ